MKRNKLRFLVWHSFLVILALVLVGCGGNGEPEIVSESDALLAGMTSEPTNTEIPATKTVVLPTETPSPVLEPTLAPKDTPSPEPIVEAKPELLEFYTDW